MGRPSQRLRTTADDPVVLGSASAAGHRDRDSVEATLQARSGEDDLARIQAFLSAASQAGLSPCELEVTRGWARGEKLATIARRRGIAPSTARVTWLRARRKLRSLPGLRERLASAV